MADIHFKKINESFSLIETDPGIRREIKDYLTFDVPNAKFMPAYKNGWWDGKISLVNKDGTIYTGLASEVQKFANERMYSFEKKGFPALVEINPKEILDEIMSWKPTYFGKGGKRVPLTPHKEQLQAIWLILQQKRVIIESATSAGKSFIMCAAIRKLYSGRKFLIIVPRVDLATQLRDNFHEYFEDWNPGIDVLYSGEELTDKNIVISTWQSIIKKDKSYFEQFDAIIEDEVQDGESDSTKKIVESCINSTYRAGLSGTLKDSKTHILTLTGLFGKPYLLSTVKDNIEAGVSANLKITVFKKDWKVNLKPKGDKWDTGEKYKAELDFLYDNEERNNLIVSMVGKLRGTNLVLFKHKRHGNHLYELLKKKNPNTFLIHSDISKTKREEIKQLAINNPDQDITIVASVGTFAKGINIRNIKSAILTSHMKGSNTDLRQSIGRGLRIKDDNSEFKFFDIFDSIGTNSSVEKQSIERMETYIEQQFDYSIVKLP